jgi:hypothetical protein
MTTTKIVAGGIVAVGLGAYLRWAVRPVAGSYRLGRAVGARACR